MATVRRLHGSAGAPAHVPASGIRASSRSKATPSCRANTCIETTARYAAELGCHVTLVRDATAALSVEAMRAAHAINGPTYAHTIVATHELLPMLPTAV